MRYSLTYYYGVKNYALFRFLPWWSLYIFLHLQAPITKLVDSRGVAANFIIKNLCSLKKTYLTYFKHLCNSRQIKSFLVFISLHFVLFKFFLFVFKQTRKLDVDNVSTFQRKNYAFWALRYTYNFNLQLFHQIRFLVPSRHF